MTEMSLRSRRFREEREVSWQKLEDLLKRLEKGSLRHLSDDEIIAIPVLYRAALSALSVARATSLDHNLVEYLEDLSTRGYFLVYGTRTTLWRRVGGFFARGWPLAAQALRWEILASALILLLGVAVGYTLVTRDPDWFFAFVPSGLAGGRDPSASTSVLRHALYGGQDEMLSLFATYLFTHNAQIAILAFALGFAFCLPTVLLLAYTGCMVGAFFALYAAHGLAYNLGGWMMVHGVTELSAIVLAGAAGFRIGWTIAFPGARTRLQAASEAGRQAAVLMAGVVVMLICAGLLEGIVRQIVQVDSVRYAIAASTAAFWTAYLFLPRQRDA